MKTFRPFAYLPSALCASLLLVALIPATGQAGRNRYYAEVRQAIRGDLLAIPAGTPATAEQKKALSADLTSLFPFVYPLPTVTLDFLTERLADAVSAGAFAPEDVRVVAKELATYLGSTNYHHEESLEVLQATLAKARVDPALSAQITAAMTALPLSFYSDVTSADLRNDLAVATPDAADYRRAAGDIYLTTTTRPTFNRDGTVSDPAVVRHTLSARVRHLPVGKYQVSVTTSPGGATVELGTFGVRHRSPVTGDSVEGAARGSGDGYFSDGENGRPVPDGLALDEVSEITIKDVAGVTRFTGNLDAASPEVEVTQYATLHLVATAAAPTAGGNIGFTNIQSYNPDRMFTFSAVGLPASATLTWSVNGKVVGPVRTGPTGSLFIKEYYSFFSTTLQPTDIVNLLPDAVDLAVAKTFSVNDAQGNVLASAGR